MRSILERRNQQLQHDLDLLQRLLTEARPPPELSPFRDLLLANCRIWQGIVERNVAYLRLQRDRILPEILSNTWQAILHVRLLNTKLAIPVLRASAIDRLSLATIGWLHAQHPETKRYPPAFSNGDCAVYPFMRVSPLYTFPCVEQRGLLYQPLLFHEFGHLLYACHRQEMDALVGDLQREVEDLLKPPSQRNDLYSEAMTAERQMIADTWYIWTQELFCDAVGLTIGGPSFLRAFSAYVSTLDPADYYRPPVELEGSLHPVTWLRVQFLAQRAAVGGFTGLATEVENEWRAVVKLMGVIEDYHGFYDDELSCVVGRALDDMLTEGEPRKYSASEAAGGGWSQDDSPVRLFNWAWQSYAADPEHYATWEASQIEPLLSSPKAG